MYIAFYLRIVSKKSYAIEKLHGSLSALFKYFVVFASSILKALEKTNTLNVRQENSCDSLKIQNTVKLSVV